MIICGKMLLNPGKVQEYQKRHQELWEEMKKTIFEHGAKDYWIYFDQETNILFSFLNVEDEKKWDEIKNTSVCQKWWKYMTDIMETNPDNSPVFVELKNVFELHKK